MAALSAEPEPFSPSSPSVPFLSDSRSAETPSRSRGRRRRTLSVGHIAADITNLFTRRPKAASDGSKLLYSSVFSAQANDPEDLESEWRADTSAQEFQGLVDGIRSAIDSGIHPKMITKGSSGSYFARAVVEGETKIVGVFKPKDEEPYGRLNPKWDTLTRSDRYVSEAAASVLDARLKINIVPRTELVELSSSSFFYDWSDRRAFRRGTTLPPKVGSLQTFKTGYQDGTEFLNLHPWPGRGSDYSTSNTRPGSKDCLAPLNLLCGKAGSWESGDERVDEDQDQEVDHGVPRRAGKSFSWTPGLQRSFRQELEKLVILDFIMRNTDRGLDNFLVQYVDPMASAEDEEASTSFGKRPDIFSASGIYAAASPMGISSPTSAGLRTPGPNNPNHPYLKLAAIDNSLSFPHTHPSGWREFTPGWLFLPVSLIGQPFSQATRQHFIPLLSDPKWWTETINALRTVFQVDPDFNEPMFARQMAIVKGQGWNVLQSLRNIDEGPLELCRRIKVLIWDEEMDLVDDGRSAPKLRGRGRSSSTHVTLDHPELKTPKKGPTPVPLARQTERIHGSVQSASGIAVLKRLERLDEADHGLQSLRRPTDVDDEDDDDNENDRLINDKIFDLDDEYDNEIGDPLRSEHSSQTMAPETSKSHTTASAKIGQQTSGRAQTQVVIAERLETVKSKAAFFSNW